MDGNIEKDLLLQVFKTREFKEWLLSRRWFSHKSELSNLQYDVNLDYFEAIDSKIIITVIKIIKAGYDKVYFVPFLHFEELENILEESEKIKENMLKLQENSFIGTVSLIEAEYCLFFWKSIVSRIVFVDDVRSVAPSSSVTVRMTVKVPLVVYA